MTRRRVLSVMATAALMLLRPHDVIGQTAEDCMLDRGVMITVPAEAPVSPPESPMPMPCQEVLEGIPTTTTTTTSMPGGPDAPNVEPGTVTPPAPPLSPPSPVGTGCRAVDPGTPTCSFVAIGWLDIVVFSVVATVDVLADGERVGGFGGAGYEPPQLFSAVVPAAPGNRVVVRAERGWVVVRSG